MLHIHVFFVAPLRVGYMAQPGTDQHKGRVAVRKVAHHTGASDLPVQSLNHIISTDASPMLPGKIAIGQRLFNAILYLLGCFFQPHRTQFLHHSLGLLAGSFLALLNVDCFEHLSYSFTFERGVTAKMLR